jgi:uncharacterized protein DUF1329
MTYRTKMIVMAVVCMLAFGTSTAMAKVSATDAAKLKSELMTPLGAQKKGNAEGTIPAWTGDGVKVPAGYNGPGSFHPDPFADEKPLFVITSANVDKYADKLTEGQKALFEAYPDTFKMPVYKTHRTMVIPDWYAENTYKNALSAELESDGNGVLNAKGGIPFPLPKNGIEVLWNHLLRFQGVYRKVIDAQVIPDAEGRYVLDKIQYEQYFPYYDTAKEGSDILSYLRVLQLAPPRTAGDTYLLHDYMNPKKNPRNAWRYFSGQRRVRRAPVLAYDTPVPTSKGIRGFDEVDMFYGSPDRFEWKLLGKKEIFIPYNNYRLGSDKVKYSEILTKSHPNPDLMRYELHRVWIIEGTLKAGKRHLYSRRVKYVDEDSWAIAISDKYDERGKLWRPAMSYLSFYWEVPAVFEVMQIHYDLTSRLYNAIPLMNEEGKTYEFHLSPPKDAYWKSSSLRRSGVR